MTKLKTIIYFFVFFLLLSFVFGKEAKASVGNVELRSTTNEDYRCYANSMYVANNKYGVQINCAGLIFPADPPRIASYVLWATPSQGKVPIKLGDLGKGYARFESQGSFTSLYVTIESNSRSKTPSKKIVMTGGIEPISFLERLTSPTPTPEVKQEDQTPKQTDTSNLSTKDKLLLALRRAGIAAVIALVTIVGLIFVVTRSRG